MRYCFFLNQGKTTILYKLKLNKIILTPPTVKFNVETITIGKSSLTLWDVWSVEKLRQIYRHYYQHADGTVVQYLVSFTNSVNGITDC